MTVHLVEPGGHGGVFQHTMALAARLAERGVDVRVHSASDAETVPLPVPVSRHTCLWRCGGVRPRWARRAASAASWLGAGVPSCAARARRGDLVHIQGWFRPGLLLAMVAAARARGCAVAWSPHNTFSRPGRRRDEGLARRLAGAVDVVIVFSEWDRQRAEGWGARSVAVAPLPVLTCAPPAAEVERWRRRWREAGGGRPVALFAGQLRADKGLDVAVRAAAAWQGTALLAVVGQDLGGLPRALQLAGVLGVDAAWDEGYVPVERFSAAVAAADVVVCPYRVASQSAVLAMARALDRPTVSSTVGGLPELSDVAVPPDDPAALAAAVRRVLAGQPAPWRQKDASSASSSRPLAAAGREG